MKHVDVIERLQRIRQFYRDTIEDYTAVEAVDMAIEAVEKQEADRWIPVTERLPEDDTEVFVYLFDIKSPYIAWICDGRWYTEEFEIEKENEPVAWRPLPEPYTEEEA